MLRVYKEDDIRVIRPISWVKAKVKAPHRSFFCFVKGDDGSWSGRRYLLKDVRVIEEEEEEEGEEEEEEQGQEIEKNNKV